MVYGRFTKRGYGRDMRRAAVIKSAERSTGSGRRLAALAAAALLAGSAGTALGVVATAQAQARAERAAFAQAASLRAQRLAEGAERLAADPGFRDAAAAGDGLVLAAPPSAPVDVAETTEPQAEAPASDEAALTAEVDAGLAAGAFVLRHRPRFDMRRHVTAATQAVMCWDHPTRGLLRPDQFMADAGGRRRELAEWALTQAIADQHILAARGHAVETAVAAPAALLEDAGFLAFCEVALKQAAGPIGLEFAEADLAAAPDAAFAALDRLADLGARISITGYGAGLSSLPRLKRLRGHELKVDRSLVEGVTSSQRDALIVRTAFTLAHGLGLQAAAEGVETNAAFSMLAGMGCDLAEGRLIAEPMPLRALIEYLDAETQEARLYG